MNRRTYLSLTGMVSGGLISGTLGSRPAQASSTDEPEGRDLEGGLFALATDVDGSSEDSRVSLGTLGHHHVWAGTDSQNLPFDEAEPGTEHWHTERESSFGNSAPTIVDGIVYIGTDGGDQTGYLVARDAVSGEEQWQFETNGSVQSSPQVVDTTAFVIAKGDAVYAIDTTDGSEQWRSEDFRVNTSTSPTANEESIFVTSRHLYAVDATTGETQWHFAGEGRAITSPTVVDNTVFAVFQSSESENDQMSFESTLHAVDTATGDEQWQFDLGDRSASHGSHGLSSSPTVGNELVYVAGYAGSDDVLYAVDIATGDEQWQVVLGEDSQPTSPTVANGLVYIVRDTDRHDRLYAIDAVTGERQWSFESGWVSPTIAGGTVFVIDRHGVIYAVEEATGEQQWSFDTGGSPPGSPPSPPTVVDGTLFVASSYNPPPKAVNGHEDQPGFGIPTALAGLAGTGYMLKRWLPDQKSEE